MQENFEKNIDSEKDKNEKNDKKSEDSNQKENDNPDKVDKDKNEKEEDNNNNIEKKEIEKNGKDKKEKKEEKDKKEEDKDSLNNDTDNKKSSSNSVKDEEDSLGDFESNSENKEDDSGEGEDEENDDEDDIDEDDDDDDDDEDDDKTDNTFSDDKKKKDPYHSYINSKVENFIYFDDLEKGDYLYGIEQNKYYKIININSKSGNKCDKYYISLELIDNLKKTKKEKIKMKKISDNIIYKALNYDNDNNKNENKTKDKKEEEKKDISNKELTTNTNNDDNINEKKGEIKKENKNEEKKNENENKNEIKNENENENNKQCNDELSNNNIKKQSNIDDKVLVKDNEKEIENKIENKNENKNESKNENKNESKNENKNESKNESKNEIKENKQDTKEENNKENNKVDKNENIIENNKDKKENKDDDNNKENEKIKNDKKKNNEDPDESNKKLNIKKASNKKNITVSISMKDYLKYTFLQKINIFYINYLNIFHKIDMIININCSINDIIIKFQRLYHIPCDRYSDEKPPLIVFINNKKFSTSNKTRKKYFTPNKFDYKNDYIIILEKENHKFEEIDMGTRNNYINLKGVKIPHFVFSSYYNLQVQSFIISKNLPFLECEVYEVKKELYFNIDPENEKNTKKKVKEFLDLNWKERANLISVIKSGNIRKSKENYDANCFEINRKFILSHGKIYIFLVTSSNKKVYAFNPRHITKDGVVIISKDDKALLSGFKAKKISDFIAYN